jgi:peptide deformylase
MALVDIKVYGDPILRKKAKEVKKIDSKVANLVCDLVDTLYYYKGVGLAAPQIGVGKRVIVVDVSEKRNELIVLINPVVVAEEGEELREEGCLSLPGINAEVLRPKRVVVKGLNLKGEEIELSNDGFLARVLLHEIDHLNGILFIDRIEKRKKKELLRELKKLRKASKKEKVLS